MIKFRKLYWYIETSSWHQRIYNRINMRKLGKIKPFKFVSGPNIFAVLTTPSNFMNAIWSSLSWLRWIDRINPIILIDGDITNSQRQLADSVIPSIEIKTINEFLDKSIVSDYCDYDFIKEHPLGKKFLAIIQLQKQGSLLFSDDDVLVYNKPTEVLEYLEKGLCCFNCEPPDKTSKDQAVINRLSELGLSYHKNLNSGLMTFGKNTIPDELVHILLSDWNRYRSINWLTEQTFYSIICHSISGEPLSHKEYYAYFDGMFILQQDVDYNKIRTRHFTTPVRHIMRKRGISILYKSIKENK